MLHEAPAYQGMSPIHLKQFIIFLSCFSAVPVLQGAALADLPGHHQLHAVFTAALTWHALFLIVYEIPKRNTTTALCSRGGSFSFNDVASFKYTSINRHEKRSQRKNFCLLCCSCERQCCDIMALTAKTTTGLTSKYVF